MFKKSAIIFFLFIFMAAPLWAGEQTKDIQVIQQTFQAIQNPAPSDDFKLSVWVDRENNTYNVGEAVTFFFKSNRDCYISLINIGTSGKVTLIYPNQYDQNNQIKANVTYRLPREGSFQFTASGPAGTEMVKAIATLKPADLMNWNTAQAAGPFKQFDQTKGRQVAKDISVTLNQTPAKQWAEYAKVIKVVQPTGPQPVSNVQAPAANPPATTGAQTASTAAQTPAAGAQGYHAFKTDFWTDKPAYRIGEPVRFYFKVNKNAYITLLSIGTSGKVRILFPNRFAQANLCQAGVTYTVPGMGAKEQYIARGPAGTETIRLIATQNQFSLSQTPYTYATATYPVLNKSADQVAKDIQVLPAQQPDGAYYDEAAITIRVEP